MKYKKPQRTFEFTGFVDPEKSYYVNNLDDVVNWNGQDMKTMVDNGRYFSIFSPRQSGKTTFFHMFSKSLDKNPDYIFILMSFENCENYSPKTFYHHIQDELYDQLIHRLKDIKCNQLKQVNNYLNKTKLTNSYSFYLFFKKLNQIIIQKKIVIFIDEFDGIPLSEIKDFLTTLRKLYQKYKNKKDKALYSVGLIGIRNLTQLTVGGVSPFNIADHIELPPFTLKNIHNLYLQYSQESNQSFDDEAVSIVYELTNGQPWLVNRLGNILTTKIKPKTTHSIIKDDVNKAITLLLKEKNSHFDNLKEKILLYKETLKKISNQNIKYLPYDDGQAWLYQYGIIKEKDNYAVIANPIYKMLFENIVDNDMFTIDQKKKIFISYSHEDRAWLDKFIFFLNPLKYKNVEFWFDDDIQTGDFWSEAIFDKIKNSHMTICLISQNFLNSEFIRTKEIPAIIKKQKEGMIIIPILLEDCLWHIVDWLNKIQIFPKDTKPIDELQEKDQNKKFMEIVTYINNLFIKENNE